MWWKTPRPGAFAWLLLAVLLGCGPSKSYPPGRRVGAFPVEGSVTVGGTPAAGVRVAFHGVRVAPENKDRVFHTVTDAAGRFAPTTNEPGDGMPNGEYAVTFTWPETLHDDPRTEADRLDGRFASPKTSAFRAVVGAGSNALPNFDLPPPQPPETPP